MKHQYLQYVREQLMVATADLSGATKGQLVAFAENAQFTATARSRGRKKIADPATGRMVNPSSPPIPGQQSRAKGSSIALVIRTQHCCMCRSMQNHSAIYRKSPVNRRGASSESPQTTIR